MGFFTRPMLGIAQVSAESWADLPLSGVIMLCGQVARWGPAHYLNSRPVYQRALSEKWAPPRLPGLLLGWLGGYFRTTRPHGGRFPPLYVWRLVAFCWRRRVLWAFCRRLTGRRPRRPLAGGGS